MNFLSSTSSPQLPPVSEHRHRYVRFGFFSRKDGSRHQRYRCQDCGATTSDAFFNPCYRQRRRDLNPLIFGHLVSCVSMRRSARLLKTNRKTVVRKFLVLGKFCDQKLASDRAFFAPASEVEFDDLETFVHTKMKPLSVLMVVESGTRHILGWSVATMAAKGRLAKASVKKYGKQRDERKFKRDQLFMDLKPHIEPWAIIKSDQNPHYSSEVKKHFPFAEHKTFKGRKGCVVGQGELKGGGFDPLFTLNHTFAMFRDNMKRLSQQTWCTTKKKDRLHLHIAMYVMWHNYGLIPQIENPEVRWPNLDWHRLTEPPSTINGAS